MTGESPETRIEESMKTIYIIYQIVVALPLLLIATIVCALGTIIAGRRWRNAEWVHRLQQGWARLFCYLLFIPVEVDGLEHIRPRQSYVFVSNHQSFYDVFVIYGWLPVIFKWLMKQEVGRIPLVGQACQAAGHICVDRLHPRAAQESLKRVEAELQNGVSTVIFPEGTRTPDGEVKAFKRGAFQVALDLHLPVIPITMIGCYEVMNRHAWFVTRHPIKMVVGEEIKPEDLTIELARERVVERMEN